MVKLLFDTSGYLIGGMMADIEMKFTGCVSWMMMI
jgi:hypothetical protein